METTFSVPGITCGGCANTIKRTLGTVPGVSEVSVDVPAKNVRVSHDDTVGREMLAATLEGAGYPTSQPPGDGGGQAQTLVPRAGVGREAAGTAAPVSTVKDPVCGMDVEPDRAAGSLEHEGRTYFFCSTGCREKFRAEPAKFVTGGGQGHARQVTPPDAPPAGTIYTCPMHPEIRKEGPGSCPICGMALEPLVPTRVAPR